MHAKRLNKANDEYTICQIRRRFDSPTIVCLEKQHPISKSKIKAKLIISVMLVNQVLYILFVYSRVKGCLSNFLFVGYGSQLWAMSFFYFIFYLLISKSYVVYGSLYTGFALIQIGFGLVVEVEDQYYQEKLRI